MSFHHHTSHHEHPQVPQKNLKTAFLLNFFFTIIEFIGGFLTHSIAIMSDAVHDLGDTVTIGLSWYFEKFSLKKRDNQFSYGYRRFSLVAALISSIILLVGSFFIILEAVPRIKNPAAVNGAGMFGLACLGILINGFAVLKLKTGKSANEKVVRLHLLEDVLGWFAVLVGSIFIMTFDVHVIDPVLSLLISVYILWNVFSNLRGIVRVFLQGIPGEINIDKVVEKIITVPDVDSVHDVHIWSLDGRYHVLSAHIVVPDDLDKEKIITMKNNVRQVLRQFDIEHETLEVGYKSESCNYTTC
ncbi:cation transporter [candidate division KSB1 bacterium]|nr:cation transporter [candidate division KSB1 bacterium]